MRITIALLLIMHGIAHLPGFLVSWRLADLEELPYRTTILAGRFDLGDGGIRVVGLLWAMAALAFVATGTATWLRLEWWTPAALATTAVSSILCLLGWPEARIGLFVNAVFIVFLLINRQRGLVP